MKFAKKLMVEPGSRVRLADCDPGATHGFEDKDQGRQALARNVEKLADLQYRLYAENRRSVLVIFQAMDAGGKDGVIRRVMTGLNPQGCRVIAFKAPNSEELARDFLWRVHHVVPRRGQFGIFNRSHYEDVLAVRVKNLAPKKVWSLRYDHINAFERLLADNGTKILKFFLLISREEQYARLRKRLDDPEKHWKFDPADIEDRKRWDDYVAAYEEAFRRCSTPCAPWYVIPANHKWYRDAAVSQILVETLTEMRMKFPQPAFDVSKIVLE